jgi:hypothetical protein
MLTGQRQAHLAAVTERIEAGRPVVEVPIPPGRCQAPLVEVTDHLEVGRRAEVPIPADQCPARLVAADPEAVDTAALLRGANRAEATPEAARMAALLMADTIIANDFHPVSPHSSLTVRRPRKGPPVLPEQSGEDGGTDFA